MCAKCKTEQDKTIECHICDTDITDSDINTCQDCNKPTCDDCITEYNSNPLCQECRDENYYSCEKCNDLVHSDDIHCADDSCYCESCYDSIYCNCEDCGEVIRIYDSYSNDTGCNICESCYDNYSTCSSCGETIHNDNSNYCSECSETFCNSCSCECNDSDNEDNINLDDHANALISKGKHAIADYHAETNWEFKSDKLDTQNAPYFGLELEIECKDKDQSAKKVGQLIKGNAIVTHDGSLTNGFEIVFTPHKYQSFRKLNFKHILKEISRTQATSHDSGTCGLHIHLERKSWFNTSYLFKGYWYTNADLYQKFYNLLYEDITKLSRRTPEQIANYCTFQTSRGSRYSAVNLTPDNTVEIRIWRGTLNPRRFKANIQFTLAVYDFLQQHSKALLFGNTDKLKQVFHDWLAKTNEYQVLVSYCKSKKLFGFTYRNRKQLPLAINLAPTKKPTEQELALLAYRTMRQRAIANGTAIRTNNLD